MAFGGEKRNGLARPRLQQKSFMQISLRPVIQGTAMEAPKDALKLRPGVTLPVDAGAVKAIIRPAMSTPRGLSRSRSPFR
jgi:hypothetical protein